MTPQQRKCYDFLWSRRGGATPTYVEIAEHLGIKSKSGVVRIVDALEQQGVVKRNRGDQRTLTALPLPGLLDIYDSTDLVQELRKRGWVCTLPIEASSDAE